MKVFSSKIKILDSRITLGSAFYKDKAFLVDLDKLKHQHLKLSDLNSLYFNNDIDKKDLMQYIDGMEATIINLQEDIYRVQITSFGEVTVIIKNMLDRAKWYSLLSIFLLFLIILISTVNAARLKELIKKKNLFISSTYHEMAGSAQSIVMAVDIIEHELKQYELRQELQKIAFHTDKIIEQTREVMDYSRFELGTVKVDMSVVNVNALISESVGVYISKGINKFHTKSCAKDLYIETDKYKLSRVIINALDNANKYTIDGDVFINTKYRDGALYFRVRDTGVGFDMKELKNLFIAFNQGSKKHTRQGLGLGLTIIKSYVELLKGHLRVRSKINQGTTLLFRIPVTLVIKKPGYQ